MTVEAHEDIAQRIRTRIRDVPDFPQPGVLFKDITPVLAANGLLGEIVDHIAAELRVFRIDRVAAIESRGFLFGAPLAMHLGVGFAPIRKPGKLPHQTHRVDYALEYGTDSLEAHVDAFLPDERVLLVDDVLATGGTAAGAVRLVHDLGADVVATAFVIELSFLGGRARLGNLPVHSIVQY